MLKINPATAFESRAVGDIIFARQCKLVKVSIHLHHLILNWKKMIDTMATGDDDNDRR